MLLLAVAHCPLGLVCQRGCFWFGWCLVLGLCDLFFIGFGCGVCCYVCLDDLLTVVIGLVLACWCWF